LLAIVRDSDPVYFVVLQSAEFAVVRRFGTEVVLTAPEARIQIYTRFAQVSLNMNG